jgi:hypothetical protein
VLSIVRPRPAALTLTLSGALALFGTSAARGGDPHEQKLGKLRDSSHDHPQEPSGAVRMPLSDTVGVTEDDCRSRSSDAAFTLTVRGSPKRLFSVDGYRARTLLLGAGAAGQHCVVVAWPAGPVSSDAKPSRVAARIDPAWFAVIENTLARIPASHARTVRRIVIDNRPKEHGIAPFDRQSLDDERDGHTIWLHEHLFLAPNHWARGNFGFYFAYHVNRDGTVIDGAAPDHDLFSPVLLHEIGHLVMYQRINTGLQGAAATSAPACAEMCGDRGDCDGLVAAERETGCVSPYCMPFRFRTGTENWAEQYRFFYQGSRTRSLLSEGAAGCLDLLAAQSAAEAPRGTPWQRGLPDMTTFRPSRWDSCAGRACKPF